MLTFRRIVLQTGVAGGLLFVAHASFPNVNSWPMIWPVLAGAVAFWLATREPKPHRLRSGLAAALVTGVIIGVIAFVGTSIVMYVVVRTVAAPPIRESGVSPGLVTSAGMLGLGMLGLVDVVVTFIAGALMLPVRYLQVRHTHA